MLGLLLWFYVSGGDKSSLCLVFGAPPSIVSRVLRRAELALAKVLVGYRSARITWLSGPCQVERAWLVEAREPCLTRTFGFINGKISERVVEVCVLSAGIATYSRTCVTCKQVQEPSRQDVQNALYNGCLHIILVTGTLCFSADSCIIWFKHNCLGSWNDADTLAGFRDKLVDPHLCPISNMASYSTPRFRVRLTWWAVILPL